MAFGKVHEMFWDDPRVRALSEPARYFMLYLLTCRHKNRLGLFVLDANYAAADLQWDRSRVEAAIAELIASDRIRYDAAHRVVFIPRFLRHNTLENAKVVTGACAELRGLPASPLLNDLLVALRENERSHYSELIECAEKRVGKEFGNGNANGMAYDMANCMAYRGPAQAVAVALALTGTVEQNVELSLNGAEPRKRKRKQKPTAFPAPTPEQTKALRLAIAEHLHLGRPPAATRQDGSPWTDRNDLSIAIPLAKQYGVDAIIGAISVCRKAMRFPADEQLTMRIFGGKGKRHVLNDCIALWRREKLRSTPAAARVGEILGAAHV